MCMRMRSTQNTRTCTHTHAHAMIHTQTSRLCSCMGMPAYICTCKAECISLCTSHKSSLPHPLAANTRAHTHAHTHKHPPQPLHAPPSHAHIPTSTSANHDTAQLQGSAFTQQQLQFGGEQWAETFVCCRVEWASWCTEAVRLPRSVLVLIQQMSSQRLKPHFCRQCLPASKPSALPHLVEGTMGSVLASYLLSATLTVL